MAESAQATATATETEMSLLDRALAATKQTERDTAGDLLANFTEQALAGTVSWDKSITKTIEDAIARIDGKISTQLAAVMHAPAFQKLEGTWRGLNYFVMNTETSTTLKIRVLNAPKKDLFKDLDSAIEFDQSTLFKKVYEEEFGSPGGEPYGMLIGDYEFTNHPEDVSLLEKISNVSAAGFCPFLSAASSQLMGMENWTELSRPRDLAKIFESPEYVQWNSFRSTEDSRFVTLTCPRTLARLPYGANTKPVEEFSYEEVALADGKFARPVDHTSYCWMNSAYVLGARHTDAFAKYGWCTRTRGAEGGGKVEGLPAHVFRTDDGDLDLKCPTELAITDRRESELSNLGFLPLSHYKNTDYAVFFGGQTCQKPLKYDTPEATANAAISARLPYIMATSRIAHFLKVIARDKIGSFMEVSDCQDFLDRWISQYVSADANPGQDGKARFPLAEAKVEVREVPGAPGSYHAVAWLRPFLQLEELTTSLRLVARIPALGG
ncbi:MAG: type VI secretion system contractile sheath large subunit [Planctomycetaceae bacterium]|nr:type VI secretion system contractile sheath large subunit [Planctomycetaceae bacterium]